MQILDAARLVGDPDLTVAWRDTDDREHIDDMREILRRRALTRDEWIEVGTAAHARGLLFFATVDFPTSLDIACRAGADSLKVASGDITHRAWIEEMAEVGLPIQIDTGNAGLGEIEAAVEACAAVGNKSVVIHAVPSGYPARLESINLRVITTLRQVFPEYVVAFSDHTVGRDMDVAAVALGAAMVEKTLTLDRTAYGPEHAFSLEPDEAEGFVRAIRDVEQAMGSPRRVLGEVERQARRGARRSAYVLRDLAEGTVIGADDLDWRRPGGGIEPPEIGWVVGRTAARNLTAGERVQRAALR